LRCNAEAQAALRAGQRACAAGAGVHRPVRARQRRLRKLCARAGAGVQKIRLP